MLARTRVLLVGVVIEALEQGLLADFWDWLR